MDLLSVAEVHGFGEWVPEAAQEAELLCPKGFPIQGFSAAFVFGWHACLNWIGLRKAEQSRVASEIKTLGPAGKDMMKALEKLTGYAGGSHGSPSDVKEALLAVDIMASINGGTYSAEEWANLPFALDDAPEAARTAIDYLQRGLWAMDCARLSAVPSAYIASYDGPAVQTFDGEPEAFAAFLLDASMAGVPFRVWESELAGWMPTGREQQWFRLSEESVQALRRESFDAFLRYAEAMRGNCKTAQAALYGSVEFVRVGGNQILITLEGYGTLIVMETLEGDPWGGERWVYEPLGQGQGDFDVLKNACTLLCEIAFEAGLIGGDEAAVTDSAD